MTEGGFLVKFDKKKKTKRCYAVSFDYDEWAYIVNNIKKLNIPSGIKRIVIDIEGKQRKSL
jgi:hypothetical protein